MTHYQRFLELVTRTYPYCTLTEQLQVYVQHKPGSIVPLLEELIRYYQDHERREPRSRREDR